MTDQMWEVKEETPGQNWEREYRRKNANSEFIWGMLVSNDCGTQSNVEHRWF